MIVPGLLLVLAPVLKKLRRHLVWPLLAIIGGTNLAIHTAVRSPADLRVVLGDEPAAVTVRGALAETPRLKIVEKPVVGRVPPPGAPHAETPQLKIIEKHGQEIWHCVARVRVRELRRESDPGRTDDFHPATGEIWVTTPAVLDAGFFSGQPVEIAGAIERPPLPLAEGLFDFRNYLATRGIYYELDTDSPHQWTLLDHHAARPPLTDRFLTWSLHTLALGLPVEDEPLRLLWAMTLGWRTAFTGDVGDTFLQAGTIIVFLFHMTVKRLILGDFQGFHGVWGVAPIGPELHRTRYGRF